MAPVLNMGRIAEILESGQPPGKIGGNKGPGSCSREKIWAKPDPLKDMQLDAQKLEESGTMTPDQERWAKMKIENAKHKTYETVDYDKTGHPMDGYSDRADLGDRDGGGLIIGD